MAGDTSQQLDLLTELQRHNDSVAINNANKLQKQQQKQKEQKGKEKEKQQLRLPNKQNNNNFDKDDSYGSEHSERPKTPNTLGRKAKQKR